MFLDVLGGLYPSSGNWASFSDTKENLFLVSELETAWSGSWRREAVAPVLVVELEKSGARARHQLQGQEGEVGFVWQGQENRVGLVLDGAVCPVAHIPRQNGLRTHACSNSSVVAGRLLIVAIVAKLVFCIQGEVAR